MKKCLYCAEKIKDEAIKCKHCGEKIKIEKEKSKFQKEMEEIGKLSKEGKDKCTYCEKISLISEKICPHCGKNKQLGGIIVLIWIVVVIGFILYLFFGGNSDSSNSKNKDSGPSMVTICSYSKLRIEEDLKSPSSAKHPICSQSSFSKQGSKYYYSSYVDAQNSFGAMIRTNYSCELWGFEGDSYYIDCNMK